VARVISVAERMMNVRALVCDVDGVLTDGRLNYLGDQEIKSFSALDGFGLNLAKQAGWQVALLTARGGVAVERRARELDLQTGQRKKGETFLALCEKFQLAPANVAYIGDDWLDLPAMQLAGIAASVPNAAPAVRQRAHWLSEADGGSGAVREFVEAALRVQGKLDGLLEKYLKGEGS
jgi:3-deoxy-D-manno-octulosonate 8-phosphate phosphatase (KDO 8-P phosphatase)